MPFQTLAVNFDNYRQLPTPQHRWLLMALARYADREGRCWPSMRQLAADSRMSKSSVQRYLADLSRLGVFSRSRRPGGRYTYLLTETVRPEFPRRGSIVPRQDIAVPPNGSIKANPIKYHKIPSDSAMPDDRAQWQARLRSWRQSAFWLPQWGPNPGEAGCWAPGTAT